MSGKIFINYRRGDDSGNTGRLFDRLHDAFEPEQLFLDVDNIAPGLDFVRVLNERVGECDILLAVIGKSWVDARDGKGNRRLEDQDDFVRIEIESALNQDKRVIPVLVGEAPMPRLEELPETLQPLARRNAVRLTHERFRADSQGLINALKEALTDIEEQRRIQTLTEAERQAEEQRRLAAAEAERLAQERAREEHAAAEARERAAQELRAAQEVEAARRAEEKARRDQAAAEARKRTAEEERSREAAAKRRAEADRDFSTARQVNTVAAIEAFETAHPDSHWAVEANELKAALLVRAEAYRHAMATGDVVELRSFLRAYRKGSDTLEVRAKLQSLQPRDGSQFVRQAALGLAAVAIIAIAVVMYRWAERSPAISEHRVADVAPPPSAAVKVAPADAPLATTPVAAEPVKAPQPAKSREPDKSSLAKVDSPVAIDHPSPADSAAEQIAWDFVKDSKDPDQFRRFLNQYPDSAHRAEAEDRIPTLPTTPVAVASAPVPAIDAHELTRSMQFELKRVGCFSGTVNGEFDTATQAALHQFAKLAAITLPDEASPEAISALRGIEKRVCPLLCGTGRHADGDTCVANAEPAAPPKAASPQSAPSQSAPPQAKQPTPGGFVDARTLAVGSVIQGGVTTCGPNGCQHIPKNCHAVKQARNSPEWKGMGGKIVCP